MEHPIPLAAADLWAVLDRELRRRRPRDCRLCHMPLPFRVDRASTGYDWQVVLPEACAEKCSELIEDLVRELQPRYTLRPSTSTA